MIAFPGPTAAAETPPAPAGPPVITHHYPAGGRIGTQFKLELGGAWPAWPIQGRATAPGVRLTPTKTAGQFQVEIAPDAAPGPLLLWFFNRQGAAAPRQFVVGRAAEVSETDALSAAAGAPIPQFPVTLNGRLLQPNETDSWLLPLTQPVHLEARLLARQLDSPLLARLSLWGDQSEPIAEAAGPEATDPVLSTDLNLPGLYTLRVGAVTNAATRFGPAAIYRLEVTAEIIEPPPANSLSTYGRPLTEGILRPVLSRNVLTPPDVVQGFINPHGDVDVYGLETRTLQRYAIRLVTSGNPSFIAQLEITDADGEPVSTETGSVIELDWVSPNGGQYVLRVSEAAGGGAPTYGYRLSVDAGGPEFLANLATNRVRLPPGGELRLPLRLVRPPEDRSAFALEAADLPAGVTLVPVILLPGMNSVLLHLRAGAEAPPATQLVHLSLLPLSGALPMQPTVFGVVQGRHAPLGALLINETAGIWLTVPPPVTP